MNGDVYGSSAERIPLPEAFDRRVGLSRFGKYRIIAYSEASKFSLSYVSDVNVQLYGFKTYLNTFQIKSVSILDRDGSTNNFIAT